MLYITLGDDPEERIAERIDAKPHEYFYGRFA